MVSVKSFILVLLLFLFHAEAKLQTTTVSHLPTFQTLNQNMWGASPSININDTIDLSPPWIFGIDQSVNQVSRFLGGSFGVKSRMMVNTQLGPLQFKTSGFSLGTVDVDYNVQVDLTMPASQTFNAGQDIKIATSSTVLPSSKINTVYPTVGEIALDFPIIFDAAFLITVCIYSCLPDIAIIPDDPGPIVNTAYTLFKLNQTELTYACSTPPLFNCTDNTGLPYTVAGDPLSGTFDLPNVTVGPTTIIGKNLFASGSDPYLNINFDVISFMGNAPGVGAFFKALNGSRNFPTNGIPDATGTKRSINVFWNLFGADFNIPISNNQEFKFVPTAFVELSFPAKLEYAIIDPFGNITPGPIPDSIVKLPVGDTLMLKYPCNYEFMDFNADYTITNQFSNKTYDRIDLNLIFSAIEFGFSFPGYTIIPSFCISIPFASDFCFPNVGISGFGYSIGPLIGPETVPLASVDLPPYVDDTWSLAGFTNYPIATPFRITPKAFTLNLAGTDALCFGDSTGAIVLSDSGATMPLTYAWSNSETTRDLNNIPAGAYHVIVTDANGCTSFKNITINEPPKLEATFTKTDLLCNGVATGAIDVSVTGGVGTYIFAWSNGSTSEDISGLSAGIYTLTITDASFCSIQLQVELIEPPLLSGIIAQKSDPLCFGDPNGSLKLEINGGTEPYRYTWSNGDSTEKVVGLSAGAYNVTVTDKNNCTTIINDNLNEPTMLSANITVVKEVSCKGGSDGMLDLTVNGGTIPYTFEWLKSSNVLSETTEDLQDLSADTYSAIVTDANNCKTSSAGVITQPNAALSVNLIGTKISCFNGNDGTIDLTVNGGTSPYAYSWTNGDITEDPSNLPAGKHEVDVVDAKGCIVSGNIMLLQESDIQVSLMPQDISCQDQTDGLIIAKASGGVPPYTHQWSNGEDTKIIENLSSGDYELILTDQNNCTKTLSANISIGSDDCLFIPSAFTPNGDGFNDTWVIRNIHLYPNVVVEVFNKWGNHIFSSIAYTNPWDGTRNNKAVASGTYYYTVNLNNGEPIKTGALTIIRDKK